jgi:ATP-dependent helicase/nuclease subunit B
LRLLIPNSSKFLQIKKSRCFIWSGSEKNTKHNLSRLMNIVLTRDYITILRNEPPPRGLKIIFGLDLDGYQDLQPRDRFNESICGPHGFLGLLELRLGLPSKAPSSSSRIVQYREFLQRAASMRSRFYTAWFAKDPLAVAETLLRWRDELVLAGWDGSADPADTSRIRDLAEVERLAGPDLLPGFGDRVRKALTELDRRDPKFGTIEVLENRDSLPLLLRRVFGKLGASFRSVSAETLKPEGSPGTDLHKIESGGCKIG